MSRRRRQLLPFLSFLLARSPSLPPSPSPFLSVTLVLSNFLSFLLPAKATGVCALRPSTHTPFPPPTPHPLAAAWKQPAAWPPRRASCGGWRASRSRCTGGGRWRRRRPRWGGVGGQGAWVVGGWGVQGFACVSSAGQTPNLDLPPSPARPPLNTHALPPPPPPDAAGAPHCARCGAATVGGAGHAGGAAAGAGCGAAQVGGWARAGRPAGLTPPPPSLTPPPPSLTPRLTPLPCSVRELDAQLASRLAASAHRARALNRAQHAADAAKAQADLLREECRWVGRAGLAHAACVRVFVRVCTRLSVCMHTCPPHPHTCHPPTRTHTRAARRVAGGPPHTQPTPHAHTHPPTHPNSIAQAPQGSRRAGGPPDRRAARGLCLHALHPSRAAGSDGG